MTSIVGPLRQDVAIGEVVMGNKRIAVYGSYFFLNYLNQQIFNRLGGSEALTNEELEILTEQLSASTPVSDTSAQAAQQIAIEAMGEVASLRGQLDTALQLIGELSARLDELPRLAPDITSRISQIEDRLQ